MRKIRLRDPAVRHGPEAQRLNRQCRTVLAMLQVGPCSNRDLASVALKYTSRISDLRGAGYRIAVVERDTRTGLAMYALRRPLRRRPARRGGR